MWRLIACAFLPFAAGYYLSYLFRVINTLIAGRLASDLGLGAAEIGLVTSIYFLIVMAAQIPIGMLLDRYGPRRVQSALLAVAAGGAALFGLSTGFVSLLVARAMIGLGTAAALISGLKIIVLWFPRERIALLNGYMIMLGSLGAVTATAPSELLLDWMGWRTLFETFAAASALAAILIYLVVPERSLRPYCGWKPTTLKTIYSDARFWRIAPLSATCIGSAWALQSLWAAPWLCDVEGLNRASVVGYLFVMAVTLSISALLMGVLADFVRRRGNKREALFATVAVMLVMAELVLILHPPWPSLFPWCVVSVAGSATALTYAIIGDYFPGELVARANGGLNVLQFGSAFIVQYGTGLILDQWPLQDGHYPLVAYQAAFGANVLMQLAALAWFAVPWLRGRKGKDRASATRRPRGRWSLVEVIVPPAEDAILETDEHGDW
ncbi:arabinose ABC transporter permease [Bradyrhizobium canariense]|uniref:Arabinose ABC transporter permease n=1 Tax=Bradyrhizobium canariense TaxID=255045 RepID=A0A1X3GMY0_9BRAD|nr:MFS transporter [Bradyrhizobium canariense]OSI68533.1 arabinose ABC transporter permease [Bradyrhizobium canariense]OSI77980.1 arabinose ABC transporter permease [Bradyrhizobium canariense]OSI89209.1 arabinose ABC transporter permease [Bradyrhizobium canariense]OSI93692.1 arabinose ABC transporter permease [Bradyrhizobium canariense]OSJ03007.1 arabinose ABC transporter permease [Bradyrhizobium canariense]